MILTMWTMSLVVTGNADMLLIVLSLVAIVLLQLPLDVALGRDQFTAENFWNLPHPPRLRASLHSSSPFRS